MLFVALICHNNNIINKIAKVNAHRYHTIQRFKPKTSKNINTNRVNKIAIFISKDSEFILHYITLTDYYILNNKVR